MSVHTSIEPPGAGTCRPVCLELVGSQGSTGAVRLEGGAATQGGCFAAGAADVFQLEAAAVGELRQLNVWVDMEGAGAGAGGALLQRRPSSGGHWMGMHLQSLSLPPCTSNTEPCCCWPAGDVPPGEAAWHLEGVEVAPAGAPRPTYFSCRRWLDDRCGYRAELPPSAHNPRAEEAEYKVGGCPGGGLGWAFRAAAVCFGQARDGGRQPRSAAWLPAEARCMPPHPQQCPVLPRPPARP